MTFSTSEIATISLPACRKTYLAAGDIAACVPQIDESELYADPTELGRQSCVLTSQLNMLMLSGVLTVEHVQKAHVASTKSIYDKAWARLCYDNELLTGWRFDSTHTQILLATEFGIVAPIRENYGVDQFEEALGVGKVAAISGYGHNITAYVPYEVGIGAVVFGMNGATHEQTDVETLLNYYDPALPFYTAR